MVRMQWRHQRFVNKNLIYGALIFLLISLVYVLQQGSVKASSLIDWTATGSPVINSSYPIEPSNYVANQPSCTNLKIPTRSKYAGIISTSQLNACVVKGKYLSLAHTSDGAYLSFSSDSYFYKFHTDGTGILFTSMVLVPEGDRVGFVTSISGQKNARVYDDFSSRLELDNNTLGYRLTNWDNQLFPTADQPVIGGGGVTINFSNNGRYAVYQNAEDWPGARPGLVRVDLETGERKQFGIMWYGNYASPIPGPHYAISNDGSTVIGGGISLLSAWSLSEACLMEPIANSNRGENNCPTRTFQATDYGEGEDPQALSRTYALELSDDTSQLSFIYKSPDGSSFKRISLSPNGYVSPASQLDYLALGDSYSSGEGDTERDKRTNEKYYRSMTDIEEVVGWNQPREKCHISTRSYPYILAQGMSLGQPTNDSSTKWQSVACSGAEVDDVDEEGSDLYEGQEKGGQDSEKPRLQGYDVATKKIAALNEFIPGRQKQIEFVERYKPKVITLTLGGNDIGFAKKLEACASPLTLQWTCHYATEEAKPDLRGEIYGQYDDLKKLYEDLYKASGDQAKIYVLGYPKFINGDRYASCEMNTGALNADERVMIYNATEFMNNVIEQAAHASGVKYVDIEDSIEGGKLCDDNPMYMTGITGLNGWSDNEVSESFHPNAKGHNQIALKVWEEANNESLLDYDICPESTENSCKDETATKETITIPPYFQVQEPGYEVQYVSDMTRENATREEVLRTTRSSYTFSPRTTVEVTLFSDPVSLGIFPVDPDGSLDAGLVIPNSVPAGYHTLVVDGVTYSGERIRYKQIILVQGSDPHDLDENGTPDSQQPCGLFSVVSGTDEDLDGIDDACDPQISERSELYRWRQGYVGRVYNGSPEDENQVYVERNIWAGNRTGITDDYDPDGDGWAVIGVSNESQLAGVNIENIVTEVDFEVLGDGSQSSPYSPVVYVRPNTLECKAYRPTSLSRVQEGELRTLSIAEVSNEKCPQDLPDDNDPEEPGVPPSNESPVDRLRIVLQSLKAQVKAIISTIINTVITLLTALRRW